MKRFRSFVITLALFVAFLRLVLWFEAFAAAQSVRTCNTILPSQNYTVTTTGSVFAIPKLVGGYQVRGRTTAVFTAAPVSGAAPTLDAKVQTCKDAAGTVCADLFTADQCTTGTCYGGDNLQFIDANDASVNTFEYFKPIISLGGGSPVYTVKIELCYQ